MTEPADMTLEHLRAIRAKLDVLEDGQHQMQVSLASLEMHQAGFLLSLNSHSEMLRAITARLERIERRLELADEAPP